MSNIDHLASTALTPIRAPAMRAEAVEQAAVQVAQAVGEQTGQPVSITVTINTLSVPAPATPPAVGAALERVVVMAVRAVRSPWMPWHPAVLIVRGYGATYREAQRRAPCLMRQVGLVALATGVGSTAFRHQSLLIGIAGGIVAFFLIILRTGAYREMAEALIDAGAFPPLGAVLLYNARAVPEGLAAEWRALSAAMEERAGRRPLRDVLRRSGLLVDRRREPTVDLPAEGDVR